MAIYTLGDLCDKIISGKKPESYSGPFDVYGSGGAFAKTDSFVNDEEAILLPRKGTMNILWVPPKIWNVDTAFLIENVDRSRIIKKYLYYYLLESNWKTIIDSGTTRPATKISDWYKFKIDIPSLEEQRKIIDIIEPNEDLFINYPNTIRIDHFNHAKKDMDNLINIIEPVEKTNEIIDRICWIIEKMVENRNLDFTKDINSLTTKINNGYAYKNTDKKDSGKYKIFTIKNITNLTSYDRTSFVKNNLLSKGEVITGLSGTIGSASIILNSDEWVSNQRTLALETKYPLNVMLSIIKQKNKLMEFSTGAVQKNITKNDVLNLAAIQNTKDDEIINNLYIQLKIINTKLKQVWTKLIKILIK